MTDVHCDNCGRKHGNTIDDFGPEALLCRFNRTDERAAFDALLGKYQHALRNLVYSRLSGKVRKADDAIDDLVQILVARLLTRAHQFDCSRDFWPWVATITHHLVLDYLRSRARRRSAVTISSLLKDDDSSLEPTAPDENSAAALDAADLVAWIASHSGLFTPPQYSVLLFFYNDMAADEIAEELGITVNAVRCRLVRAFDIVRKHFPYGP